ncbi:hypothetical protein PP178_11190 [Zeaxanthinibacter sp. PT1]|uniref:hypothetical protein n=1 Tax=Zeaxanthinibacter TaxID=561554 RepID=UPI00234ABF9B|nr:hypothetical protein [Zeaxanthinibacter sp. PT1]MDC6352118.1 hypothetical protein [Zeaxanthinibacter sp. PT1]
MEINIYYVLGIVIVLYLFITVYNKKKSTRRRSREFMEGYQRKEKKAEKTPEQENRNN